jgi:hypothetical protein
MPLDLVLATPYNPIDPPVPPQPGAPPFFFGEQSNDLQLNNVNDLATVSGTEKLKQDINKILLTELGTNTLSPQYGTTLQSLIGSKYDLNSAIATIRDQINGALINLQIINASNPNPDEIPQTLQELSIQQVAVGQVQATLIVITASGKSVSTGMVIPVPST